MAKTTKGQKKESSSKKLSTSSLRVGKDVRKNGRLSPSPSIQTTRKSTSKKVSVKEVESGLDLREVVSRKEVTAVTMNMSGRSGLGLTPRYKIDMVQEYLQSIPDVILIQDAIDHADMTGVLDKVADGRYDWHFSPDRSSEGVSEDKEANDDEDDGRCVTGIAWNKDKYIGTPLQVTDRRLAEYTKWLKIHNIVIVKVDSAQRANGGTDDVYPSFIAISWHGPDYEIALRQRCQVCEQFFAFLVRLRKNNWHIPILIGGDFNMDMKSFDMDKYADFLCVPYRPVSGSLAKDLKNTFLFTVDSLQVTETSFRQFHPEIYPSPFITVRVRGRTKIKLWAIIRIQRSMRAYLKRIREKKMGMRKLKASKKRWRKKIEGEDYVSEPESEEDEDEAVNSKLDSAGSIRMMEGSRKLSEDFYNTPMSIPIANHRRRRFTDLKSVNEKQKEMQVNQSLMRTLRPAEKYEF
jgi:hypothetical protein